MTAWEGVGLGQLWHEAEEARKEEDSRMDADIVVQHSGCSFLAIQVEVGVLCQVDWGGCCGAGLHADL